MNQFAIFVTVGLARGRGEAFRGHAPANAQAALRDEPDCRAFRVMTAEGDVDTFHSSEVYRDAMVVERTIQRRDLSA